MGVFRILLSDLRFFSKIGVFEQERLVGNEFIVDVELEVDGSGYKMEDLSTSISYAEVYSELKDVMMMEWRLLESVGVYLSEHLKSRWPEILRGRVKIIKKAPPIPGIDGICGIEYLF